MDTNITVIDSIMGSGKTTHMIEHINSKTPFHLDDNSFIYITPFLNEVDRIKEACPQKQFRSPEAVDGRKLNHLNQLIQAGENIATTHKLFSMLNPESQEALNESDYTLIIDEETEFVSEYNNLTKDDIRVLYANDMIYANAIDRISWNYQKYPDYSGKFDEVKALCENGNLIRVNDQFWVWEFPVEFLLNFREVYILTYLFKGSLLSTYLEANQMPYHVKTIIDGKLVDDSHRNEVDIKASLRQLITVVNDPKLNTIGTPTGRSQPLSSSWFKRDRHQGGKKSKKLQSNISNFYKNKTVGKSSDRMWSTFSDQRKHLSGKGYKRSHVACNLRATNDYIDKKHLAYAVNVFIRPRLVKYFQSCGVEPNQDLYALSQMIQWIWRSQIRRGDPIEIYIPSERMRNLFLEWLNTEDTKEEELAA